MLEHKQINMIVERISRLFEIQLPLECKSFQYDANEDTVHILFSENNITNSINIGKDVIIDQDIDSKFVGVKIANVSQFLPK